MTNKKTVQYTPGLVGNDHSGFYVQWQNGQGFRSAMPDRETAILTAAAPELLEALLLIESSDSFKGGTWVDELRCIARAAIVKAQGG